SKMDHFLMLGPSKIIFHVETLDQDKTIHYFETIPEIVRQTVRFGLAISLDTDLGMLEPYIAHIDSIQCMGIATIGFQGQSFDPRAIDLVKKIKALYPDKKIIVDGAVTETNAADLVRAGADELVVGSFIFGNMNPRGTIQMLKSLCKK